MNNCKFVVNILFYFYNLLKINKIQITILN